MSNTHQIIEFYGFSFDENAAIRVRDSYKPTACSHSEEEVQNEILTLQGVYDETIQGGKDRLREMYKKLIPRILANRKQRLSIIQTFNNTIVVPGNLDIRLSQDALQNKAHDTYLKNKDKLINAKTIEIQGASFGGLNGCTLPNADVMHYYADNDTIINHTKDYNTTMKQRFKEKVDGKSMFNSYKQKRYNGGHNAKPMRMDIGRFTTR